MGDVFMFADETGNLDYNVSGGGSRYFGIGTATWRGDHGAHLWQATQLRFRHAAARVDLPAGYHAKDDSYATRAEVYQVIAAQAPVSTPRSSLRRTPTLASALRPRTTFTRWHGSCTLRRSPKE
jgi:hypothetical protein